MVDTGVVMFVLFSLPPAGRGPLGAARVSSVFRLTGLNHLAGACGQLQYE